MMPDRLQARLGHAFADRRLLEEALTHRSFGQPNNERFEFLGDAILDCVVSIALFGRFGELREGELSRVRASLVRQDTLHRLALELGVRHNSVDGAHLVGTPCGVFLGQEEDLAGKLLEGFSGKHQRSISPKTIS